MLVLITLEALIPFGIAELIHERGLEDDNVTLGVVRSIDQLVLVAGEKPEHGSRCEGEAFATNDIGDRSAHDQVQLEFDVMMALKFGRIPGGLDKVQEAVIAFAEFEIFQHHDKIR